MKNVNAESFALPAAPLRSVVPPTVAEAFTAAERPAKHVMEARAGETSPAAALAQKASESTSCLTVRVPSSTLKKLRQRALDRGTTVRELVIELLAGENLI